MFAGGRRARFVPPRRTILSSVQTASGKFKTRSHTDLRILTLYLCHGGVAPGHAGACMGTHATERLWIGMNGILRYPTLLVASTNPLSGKTAFAVGIGRALQGQGYAVGYCQPLLIEHEYDHLATDDLA